jgi:hypothetical protein
LLRSRYSGEDEMIDPNTLDVLHTARDALIEASDFLDDYVDIKDGPEGTQMPNEAMTIRQHVELALLKLDRLVKS